MSNEVDLRKQRKVSAEVTIDTAGLATEVKQDSQITQLATLITNTTGLNLEVTQLLVNGVLDTIKTDTAKLDVLLSTRNAEVTQLLIKGILDTIKIDTAKLDVALSTRNSEATQLLIAGYVDGIEGLLTTLNAKDFATQTTLLTRLSKADFEARINTLGQKTSALSTPVVLPSDQIVSVTNANDNSANQTTTTVAASVTSVLLKAANAGRHQINITNTSLKRLWICFFTPANSATPFFLGRDETWVFDEYTGAIYGIWDTAATGSAYITEETV